MAVTAIEPISEMRSSQHRQVFSTGEMATMLNVSLDEVDYWVRCKLIVPSIREAAGHGTRRLFGILDLKQAFLIQRLRKADWKPKQIARALSAVASAVKTLISCILRFLYTRVTRFLSYAGVRGRNSFYSTLQVRDSMLW